MKPILGCGLVVALLASGASAASSAQQSPQAGARTHAQNYKDMVLATCIANAYKHDGDAALDAGSSVSALRDWSVYDLERSPDSLKALVDLYLKRDYTNPLVESQIKGVRFDLLKCLDLYHSQELEALVKDVVIDPERTYRQDASTE
ncbi:type VI secretion system amidase immunity protein Tai4 [Ectopseudomonas khazarica]|uniref:type VI secretion system amidase immunity protein Tai4 n=1 Tax=Ectopseudomonas khazarica TaxID=2502979 RepID=UPI000645FC17